MNLIEALQDIDNINEDAVLYAERIEGEFVIESNVVLLELKEEELEWKTHEVSERKCPGYEYFLEVFIINDVMNDLEGSEFDTFEKKCERVIYYAEHDA